MGGELSCAPPRGFEYEWVQGRPFSVRRPLLFHVLTAAPAGVPGERAALDLVSRGVALAPSAERGQRSMVYARDALAGDDEFLFFTPLDTFQGDRSARPAFAFDAVSLWATSPRGFRFRVRDIEDVYARIEHGVDDGVVFDDLYESGELDEDEFHDLPDHEQQRILDEGKAALVQEDLQCASVEGTTIVDPERALEFLHLYAAAFESDEPSPELQAAMWKLVPKLDYESLWDWCPLANNALRESGIEHDWETLIEGHQPRDTPEVLYPGRVPLCCAAFFRNAQGEWHFLDEYAPDFCAEGREAWRSNPLILTGGR